MSISHHDGFIEYAGARLKRPTLITLVRKVIASIVVGPGQKHTESSPDGKVSISKVGTTLLNTLLPRTPYTSTPHYCSISEDYTVY